MLSFMFHGNFMESLHFKRALLHPDGLQSPPALPPAWLRVGLSGVPSSKTKKSPPDDPMGIDYDGRKKR
jgi:hypothetical protein